VKRGDLVTIAVAGDHGKPRPALVVQADAFNDLGSVRVLRLTSTLHDAPLVRLTVRPSAENRLRAMSRVMVDRAISVPRDKVGPSFGTPDDATLQAVSRALAVFLGLAQTAG